MSKFSVDRETKVISVILFATFLSLVGAYYLDRQYFVDWSDVERTAEYDEYALLGSTITIEYYLVNNRPVEIKVEPKLSFMMSHQYTPDTEDVVAVYQNISPASKYITIPANDRVRYGSETFTLTKTGQLVVQKTTFPDVRITILEALTSETQFNITIGLNEYVFDSQDTARLIITNRDSDGVTFGSPYFITEFVDGEWVKPSQFPLISGWDLMLHKLPVGKTTTQEIKIDTLEAGHYKVSKTINHERTQTELTFILEFDILGEC